MSALLDDLVRRLRGEYRIPIKDGLGAAGGDEPDNANEFVRHFETSPINHEAADAIVALRADVTILTAALNAVLLHLPREYPARGKPEEVTARNQALERAKANARAALKRAAP